MALSLEFISSQLAFLYDFHLWFLPFSCNSMPCSGCLDLLEKELRRMGEAQQNYHTTKLLPVTMRGFLQDLG